MLTNDHPPRGQFPLLCSEEGPGSQLGLRGPQTRWLSPHFTNMGGRPTQAEGPGPGAGRCGRPGETKAAQASASGPSCAVLPSRTAN